MSKPVKKTDSDKPWFKKQFGPTKPYQTASLELQKKFLLLCEGANTEPDYFKAFPVVSASVEAIGYGSTKTSLVTTAIEVAKEVKYKGYEVWIVFDFDVKPDQLSQQKEDCNRAIEMAQKANLKVAFSNDAFELWFLLHFQSIEGQLTRQEYYEKLSEYLGVNYEKKGKTKGFTTMMYDRLNTHAQSNQTQAIARAKKLLNDCTSLPPADRCPCTTVFELVESLNQYLKP
jgi:hypothetical protein